MTEDVSLTTEIGNMIKAFKATGNGGCYQVSLLSRSANTIEDLQNRLNLWRQDKISKWVSVEERLPEESGNYLVVLDRGEPEVHEAVFYMYKDTPNWRDPVEEYEKYKFVTHWMPLPEPPGQLHSEEEKL